METTLSRIFVSHSSLDNRQAVALRTWLVAQDPPLANEVFLDTDPHAGLRPGERWKNQLIGANSRCEAVICLLSRNWESAPECVVEYRTAENLGKQILCARLEDGTGQRTSEWQHCDLFIDGLPDSDVEKILVRDRAPVVFAKAGLHQLREAIRGAGIGAENYVWPPPSAPDRAPYRGWEPFQEVDAGVFFGRDAQIVRAMDTLRGMRTTGVDSLFVVLGPSGTGKSSFLRAGLLPRLRREDRRFALLGIMRPERRALTGETGFARAVYEGRRRLGLEQPTLGDIEAACVGEPARVRGLLTECRQSAADRLPDRDVAMPTLVLPLDQAEELFSADAGAEAAAFLALIAELAKPDSEEVRLGLIVAATIRTDRYEVMQTAPQLIALTSVVFDDLKPMPLNQFKEVITGPAARATVGRRRLSIAPNLVNRLLADAAAGGDALPLLALTLRRLYDRYGENDELTLDNYEAMGGMQRVVQNAVDEVLSGDPQRRTEQLASLRPAFIPWLATINPDNDQPMRRVASWADLPETGQQLIQQFVEKRLLVKDQRGGEAVVEVALESLLRQWDDLAAWLRDQRDDLIAADALERNSAAWEANDRNPDWLLTGSRLADAQTLAAKDGYRDRLKSTREYLASSRQAEDERLAAEERRRSAEALAEAERKRARVLRRLLVVTAIVAVVAVVLGVVAITSWRKAQVSERQAAALRLQIEGADMLAQSRPGGDVRGIQEVLAANTLGGETARSGLLDAAIKRFTTTRITDAGAEVRSVAFHPAGHMVATGGADGTVRLWNAEAGKPIGAPLTGHTDVVNGVAFSPDGSHLASAGKDGTVRMWNAFTGDRVGAPLKGHTSQVRSVAFSPDGHRLASAGADKTVRLWNADTGQPIGAPLTGHTDVVYSVAFSPDGHRLASASADHTVRLWNADTGQPIGTPLTGHTAVVNAVAFSPDGHRLASVSDDHTVRMWNTDTGKPLGEPLIGHHRDAQGNTDFGAVLGLAFSPDGHRLATPNYDNTIALLDADTGQTLGAPLTGHTAPVTSVAFSPDGHRLASGSDDMAVRIWSADSGQPLGPPLRGHTDYVRSVAFSPDGHRLASGSADQTVRLWNTDTGQPIGEPLTGHTSYVTSVAFSSSGSLIASASNDGTLRLWDSQTRQPLGLPLSGHAAEVLSVSFSPDGQRLASGSADKAVRRWPAVAKPKELCDKLTANMSRRQWLQWVDPRIPYIALCPLPVPPD